MKTLVKYIRLPDNKAILKIIISGYYIIVDSYELQQISLEGFINDYFA